jgi:fimbrial chaperone protein
VLATPGAEAGAFSVTPVRIFMAPRDRAVAVTVINEGDEELVMQADVYDWKQKADGEDDLTLTEDLILAPPILKLAPRSRQVLRLAMLNPRPGPDQLTYRLIVREVPEAKPADKQLQLQIALAFSLPVFITPPSAKRELGCTVDRIGADTVRATCENTGNAYAQLREFVLTSVAGEKLASRDSGGYILPTIKRSFDIKRADGVIPAGKAQLAVTLDDGTTQAFDVTVGD